MFDRLKSLLGGSPKSGSFSSLGLAEPAPNSPVSRPRVLTQNTERREANLSPSKKLGPAVRHSKGITFPVDDVVPASHPLWMGTLRESVEIRGNASILIIPEENNPALAPEGYTEPSIAGEPRRPLRSSMRSLSFTGSTTGHLTGSPSVARQLATTQTFLHPLIQAVDLAFSDHRPLVLSPDCIWLTIMQGFGHHLQEHAEALRGRVVRHEGKKELIVTANSLAPECWPALISQFSSQIRDHSDAVLYETLLCQFSTTTPTIRTACEVALMDTYQRYFDYTMHCVCGIPNITLQGTPDDWQRVRDRIEVLATYDLGWWTSRLAPILDQFVATSKGDPDSSFWQAIYKPKKVYVTDMATGWIADLFPYLFGAPTRQATDWAREGRGLCDSPARYRNHILGKERTNWLPPDTRGPMTSAGVSLKAFPSGLSRAPVTAELPGGSKVKIELLAGFLGASQSPEDNALSPIISWAVVQKDA
jgi:hypothetical protein